MEKFLLIVHSLSALVIIGLILLQQGKGATTGASFGGGASQTVFGSDGGGNFFTRATAIFATLFFIVSISLAYIAKSHSKVQPQIVPAAATQTAPAATQLPAVQPTSTVPATPSAAPAADAQTPAVPSSAPATNATPASAVPATPPAK